MTLLDMSRSPARRVLSALTLLVLSCAIVSVSSQGTCAVMADTGVLLPDTAEGFVTDDDGCCEACQLADTCTVAVYDSSTNLCFRIGAGDQISEDLLLDNQAGVDLYFPDGVVSVAAVNDDGDDDDDEDDIIFGLGVPELAGIGGAVVGLCCIVASLCAFCKARRKSRAFVATNSEVL